ncbi:unnamed protein product [Amoebophrya sp. A25]|nr:unnamed protein product [Amoebophrya sp. A25]|eukprot:GSA25T00002546001.1
MPSSSPNPPSAMKAGTSGGNVFPANSGMMSTSATSTMRNSASSSFGASVTDQTTKLPSLTGAGKDHAGGSSSSSFMPHQLSIPPHTTAGGQQVNHLNVSINTSMQSLSIESGETPLFPFGSLSQGLDFIHQRLKKENEERWREVLGNPLGLKVAALEKENEDLRKRLAVMRGKKLPADEVFPMYENLIERQMHRNRAVTNFLKQTENPENSLQVIKSLGSLGDRLDRVGMEDIRLFDLQRQLEHLQRDARQLQTDNLQLGSDKSNSEYREKNLQLANELLKNRMDEAHAKMLHFKALYNEKQKELDSITHSVNYISLLSEEKQIVSKRKSRIPEGGEDMWKRGFDKMRVEFIQLMRMCSIQRRKLEYAEKQKKLAQVRNKKLKADLQKAWRDLSDPQRIAQEEALSSTIMMSTMQAPTTVPTNGNNTSISTTGDGKSPSKTAGGGTGDSSQAATSTGDTSASATQDNSAAQQGTPAPQPAVRHHASTGDSQHAPNAGDVTFLPPPFRIVEEHDIVDEGADVPEYELVGPGLMQDELFPLGNHFLAYLLSSKGDYANLFLEDCVEEDRQKCERLAFKEFVALHYRSVKVKQLLEAGAKLQEVSDADQALALIQDIAKSFLSADRVTVWVVDASHGICWTRSATQSGEAFEIKIPIDKGLVGEAAMTGKAINIRDAYQDSRFNRGIDKQTGYRTKEVLCQPIVVHKRVVAVLQAINKLQKVDHSSGDMSVTDVSHGFSKDDQFFLHVIGVLGKSTLDACESKQGDYLAVRRTQALLEASLELGVELSPLDAMGRVARHMKQLFKALVVQITLIKRRENDLIQLVRYDSAGLTKQFDFDLAKMHRERRINPETREYLPMPWSLTFLCVRDEHVQSSIMKVREEHCEGVDLPVVYNGRRMGKPNIHTFPIFKRLRSAGDAGSEQSKNKGPMIGCIQWVSNGAVSAFGDDGHFRGETSSTHMAVMYKYGEILASCVEVWYNELDKQAQEEKAKAKAEARLDENGDPMSASSLGGSGNGTNRSGHNSADSSRPVSRSVALQGQLERENSRMSRNTIGSSEGNKPAKDTTNYMLYLQQKVVPKSRMM